MMDDTDELRGKAVAAPEGGSVQEATGHAEKAAAGLAQALQALGGKLAPVMAGGTPLPGLADPIGVQPEAGVAPLVARLDTLAGYLAECNAYASTLLAQVAL